MNRTSYTDESSTSGYLTEGYEGLSTTFTDIERRPSRGYCERYRAKRYGRWLATVCPPHPRISGSPTRQSRQHDSSTDAPGPQKRHMAVEKEFVKMNVRMKMQRVGIWISVLAVCWICIDASAQTTDRRMTLEEALLLGLPVVEVATVDGEEPTATPIDPPEGCIGASITNATHVPGRLRLWSPEGTLRYDSGDYIENKNGATFKVRGNWSGRRLQKPYKVKLQRKADLLDRGDEDRFGDKNWLLLREKAPTLNTPIGLQTCRLLDFCWTPTCCQVNLLFNGEYRGVYMLTEQVRRNADCRIDVDKTEGYIIERDPYWWNEDVSFDTEATPAYIQYTFKYPESDEVTEAQIDIIREAVCTMEQAIADGTYEEVLDVASFACWLLAHDVLGTSDGAGTNQFLSKRDATLPFRMETLWDFDTIMQREGEWAAVRGKTASYYSALLNSPNRAFAEAYAELWQRVGETLIAELTAWLSAYGYSDEAQALEISRRAESARWPRAFRHVSQDVEEAIAWFRQRKVWMDEQIATFVAVNRIKADKSHSDVKRYDLAGRRISGNHVRGIVIERGRGRVKNEE